MLWQFFGAACHCALTAIVGQPLGHIASVHTGREVGFAGQLRLVPLIAQLSVVQRILRLSGCPTHCLE